jgi:hypothetical protein
MNRMNQSNEPNAMILVRATATIVDTAVVDTAVVQVCTQISDINEFTTNTGSTKCIT